MARRKENNTKGSLGRRKYYVRAFKQVGESLDRTYVWNRYTLRPIFAEKAYPEMRLDRCVVRWELTRDEQVLGEFKTMNKGAYTAHLFSLNDRE